MKNNFKNSCLIVVLAFLQCLVPLLHAHAGGLHVSSHVHIHFDLPPPVHPALTHELTADLCDFPVVGAANEFKRDPASEDLALVSTRSSWLILPPQALVLPAPHVPSILPESAFFSGLPPSQAPPADS